MNTPPPRNQLPPDLAGWVAASWLLFASFTFYVTFVQYALLRRAELVLGFAEHDLAPGFVLLAVGGIIGTLVAGWWVQHRRFGAAALAQTAAALSICLAAGAVGAMQSTSLPLLIAVFAPLGLCLGLLIVVLLTLFVVYVPLRVLGIFAGCVAGAVYVAANVMATVSDRPDLLGVVDVMLVGSNVLVVLLFFDAVKKLRPQPVGRPTSIGRLLIRLAPLGLVVLIDTALFVVVSRLPGDAAVYATPVAWLKNGAAHFVAAAFAGIFYARLGWRKLTWIAAGALVVLLGLVVVQKLGLADVGGPIIAFYSAVVGCYTVALFTVFGEEAPADRPAVGIAAGMVLVGWIASPLGIILGTALLR